MASYEFLIGLRYTRAKRRNHFISFSISLISLLGMTLGMTAPITGHVGHEWFSRKYVHAFLRAYMHNQ
ncbi:MAG: hypothetical protein P0107_04250 [Nitrosomonas sp.]|nr:hypothetical protein [Nitrosomonas sp.]